MVLTRVRWSSDLNILEAVVNPGGEIANEKVQFLRLEFGFSLEEMLAVFFFLPFLPNCNFFFKSF